jgi:ribosomal protein L12E/L44/L45/RPP1/RPP2
VSLYCLLLQNSEATVVVDNIHSIVAAAAVKFNAVQIENLVALVKEVQRSSSLVLLFVVIVFRLI